MEKAAKQCAAVSHYLQQEVSDMQILKKAAGLAAAFGVLLSSMTAAPAGITASAHGEAKRLF